MCSRYSFLLVKPLACIKRLFIHTLIGLSFNYLDKIFRNKKRSVCSKYSREFDLFIKMTFSVKSYAF